MYHLFNALYPFVKVRLAYSTLCHCLKMRQQEVLYAFVAIPEGIIKVRATVCNDRYLLEDMNTV